MNGFIVSSTVVTINVFGYVRLGTFVLNISFVKLILYTYILSNDCTLIKLSLSLSSIYSLRLTYLRLFFFIFVLQNQSFILTFTLNCLHYLIKNTKQKIQPGSTNFQEGISILLKCEEAAEILETKIMEYRQEQEVQTLLKELVIMRAKISKLLKQANDGLEIIEVRKVTLLNIPLTGAC